MDVNLSEIFKESEWDLGDLGEDTSTDETVDEEDVGAGSEPDQEPTRP
jgi:hypothetical protein